MIKEHWIQSIEEAYDSRKLKLNFLVNRKLDDRKIQIKERLKVLNNARMKIHDEREEIESETRGYFAEMLSRLDSSAEPKIAALTADSGDIQRQYEEIEALIHECQRANKEPPLFLLSNIKAFKENLNYFMTKTFDPEIYETPYDLPRELFELRKTIEAAENHEILIRFKNHIIHQLLRENLDIEAKLGLQNNQNAHEEIAEWTQLADILSKKLSTFSLVCHYCAEPLNQTSVNQKCLVNRKDNKNLRSTFKGFSESEITPEEMGTGFHHFGPPSEAILSDPHLMNIMYNQVFKAPQEQNLYKEAMTLDVERLFNVVRRALIGKETQLQEAFQEVDITGLKVVNKPTLEYVLFEVGGLRSDIVDQLCRVLDPYERNLINYAELLNLVDTPGALENLPYFQYSEESLSKGYASYKSKFDNFNRTLEQKRKEEQARIDRQHLQEEKERVLREKQQQEQKAAGTGSRYASAASKIKAIGGGNKK